MAHADTIRTSSSDVQANYMQVRQIVVVGQLSFVYIHILRGSL